MTGWPGDKIKFTYAANIRHIFISPGHNYFGRPKDGPGAHPTHDVARVELRAGLGLVGDRYFGVAAHFNAQVTFVAWEVFVEVQRVLGAHELSPVLMRRNIVVEGIHLNQLIGQEFTIVDASGAGVRFQGASHCAPCAWMDAALGAGAPATISLASVAGKWNSEVKVAGTDKVLLTMILPLLISIH